MKASLAWLVAFLLTLVAAAGAAHAACSGGSRVPPIAGPDFCISVAFPGIQAETILPIDGYGDLCDNDLNQNCIIDVDDSGPFMQAFGTAPGNPNYNASFDYNIDGVINLTDFTTWKAMFFTLITPDGGT